MFQTPMLRTKCSSSGINPTNPHVKLRQRMPRTAQRKRKEKNRFVSGCVPARTLQYFPKNLFVLPLAKCYKTNVCCYHVFNNYNLTVKYILQGSGELSNKVVLKC